MKKKIWLFHHYADPPIGKWLGSYEQYSHLSKLGNEITIFCSNYNHYSHQNLVEITDNYYKIENYTKAKEHEMDPKFSIYRDEERGGPTDEDLMALQKAINPTMFGKFKKMFGMKESKGVKVTKSQLQRIIKEEKARLIAENRADRLTLNLKLSPSGDDVELEVGESGETYNLGAYTDASRQKGGLYGLMRQFEVDHGMEIPPGTMVYDVDGVDIGDLPIEQMFQAVADMYTEF